MPLHIDNDLSESEARELEEHLGICNRCASSLNEFLALEESLTTLKDDLPDPIIISAAVMNRLSPGRKGFRFLPLFRFPVFMPVVLIFSAVVTFILHKQISRFLHVEASSYSAFIDRFAGSAVRYLNTGFSGIPAKYFGTLTKPFETIGSLIMKIGDIDPWMLASISSGMTLIVILSFFQIIRNILQD